MTGAERWPLSAAVTAVLLAPKNDSPYVLKLAIKELVLVGAFTLTRTSRPRRWGGPELNVSMYVGSEPPPDRPPLPHLAASLQRAAPNGGVLREMVEKAVKQDAKLAYHCRLSAVAELRRRGLLHDEKRWYGTRLAWTPTGDRWAAVVTARRDEWRAALASGGPEAAAAVVAALESPGLALLLDRSTLFLIDVELDRSRRRDGDGSGVYVGSGEGEGEERLRGLEDIDGLSGLDGAVDDAVDSGNSSGGDGDGDGGGDGGGGGGD